MSDRSDYDDNGNLRSWQPRRAPAQPEPANQNTGHGHVRPRPDGVLARCGGPGICTACSREKAAMSQPEPAAPRVQECNDNDSPWLICKTCNAVGQCAQEAAPTVVEPPSITETQSKWGRLYTAANAVVTRAGADGQISVHSPEIDSLMDKLHDLDDGQWMPGLMPPATPPRAALTREQISELAVQEQLLLICDNLDALVEIVAVVEQAHGIGGPRNE